MKKLKIGDKILIKSRPKFWSCRLSDASPLNLSYPAHFIVTEVSYDTSAGPDAFKARAIYGTLLYGFDVKSTIDAGCKICGSQLILEIL